MFTNGVWYLLIVAFVPFFLCLFLVPYLGLVEERTDENGWLKQAYDLVEYRYVACKLHGLNAQCSEEKKHSYIHHAIREMEKIHRIVVFETKIKVSPIADVLVFGKLTLHVEKEGEILVPYKPDVDLDKVEFDSFFFEETLEKLHVKLDNKE